MEKTFSVMINVPQSFFQDYPGGREEYLRVMLELVHNEHTPWYNTISNIPRQQVVYCYLVFDGRVQLRANIMEFMPKTDMRFNDGGKWRTFKNKNWCVLTGPIVKAPKDIPQRGFRGFRYCEQLF